MTNVATEKSIQNATEFAFSLPTAMVNLCAICPNSKRRVQGKSFPKTDAGKIAAGHWIGEAVRAKYGVYFNCNDVTPLNKGHTKAKECEVTHVRFLHVDADLPDGTTQANAEAVRAQMLTKFRASEKPPSLIINSGNGFGLFWLLDEPVAVTDENREEIKARNVALAAEFGGDHCENLDRVMRLPYTVNYPNAKKRMAGRVAVLADVVSDYQAYSIYSLERFPTAVTFKREIHDAIKLPSGKQLSDGSAYASIGSPEIINADLSTLDDDLQELIKNGSEVGEDRSAKSYGVACDLRRLGWKDGAILGVLINSTYRISDHILDQTQRSPKEQAARVIVDMNKRGEKQVFRDASEDFEDDDIDPASIAPGGNPKKADNEKRARNEAREIEARRTLEERNPTCTLKEVTEAHVWIGTQKRFCNRAEPKIKFDKEGFNDKFKYLEADHCSCQRERVASASLIRWCTSHWLPSSSAATGICGDRPRLSQ